MKKVSIIAILMVCVPLIASAQVAKQVEVTKAYIPELERAEKLAIEPNMVDTVAIEPDIDYSITPLSIQTPLAVRPFSPATVTYWEFNRPKPFYVKVGAGAPLNTVLDLYASTENASTGYLMGYVNHRGYFGQIENDYGIKNTSTRMYNQVGVAAGKYFGRRVLEAAVGYDNRLLHRYGAYASSVDAAASLGGTKPNEAALKYGTTTLDIRFGDKFLDLSRTNFEIVASGSLFSSNPELYEYPIGGTLTPDSPTQRYDDERKQSNMGLSARVARAFDRHTFDIGGSLQYSSGEDKYDDDYTQLIGALTLRYAHVGDVLDIAAGADFYSVLTTNMQDWIPEVPSEIDGGDSYYVIPYLRAELNFGSTALLPFVEMDGDFSSNSYQELVQKNPYVERDIVQGRNSVTYNARAGISGTLSAKRFNYRLFGELSLKDNNIFWVMDGIRIHSSGDRGNTASFYPTLGHLQELSLNASAEFRASRTFTFWGDIRLSSFSEDAEYKYYGGVDVSLPTLMAEIGGQYHSRKLTFGLSAEIKSAQDWSVLVADDLSTTGNTYYIQTETIPFAINLKANVDWRVKQNLTIFAEGTNLAFQELYLYPFYPDYGAMFTVGVKMQF